MSLLIVAAKKTTLKSPLAAADASVVLREFVDRDGNALAMASFGEFGTIVVKQGEVWELIKFTAITPGTNQVILTVDSSGRSLLPISPYTGASTGEDFSAGAEVIVSNDPYIMSKFANLENAQTFNEVQTFAVAPISSVDASGATELIRKSQLDAAVLGSITLTPVVTPGTGGEILTVDQLVYQKDSDGKWWKCDADTAATVENVRLGITRGAAIADGAITGGVTVLGAHDASSALFTANTKYYASNTAGGFSSSAGTKEVTVGYAISTTRFFIYPRYDQTITEDEQDALAGTEGTPSASNKFNTALGTQKQTPTYAASAVGTDAYAITVTPAIAAYVTGMRFSFLADVANTGAATLAVSGLSALAIKKNNDQALVTGDIEAGQIVEVVYDGTDWQMQSQLAVAPTADVQTFTATGGGTWTKPSGAKKVFVQMWGGGGSGASYRTGVNPRAGGGGGGGYAERWYAADDLGSTESLSVATGGAAVADNAGAGNVGADSTFSSAGNLLTAYGGDGGKTGDNVSNAQGGAGGGNLGLGSPGTPVTGAAGAAGGGAGGIGLLSGGGGGGHGGAGGASYYGGGGGGGSNTTTAGGTSVMAGAGGAGSGTVAGTAGTAPGGGGGGTNAAFASGAGARGEIRVTTFM